MPKPSEGLAKPVHISENAKPRKRHKGPDYDAPISLSPLDFDAVMGGIFAIPDPDATKPKYEKGKRAK